MRHRDIPNEVISAGAAVLMQKIKEEGQIGITFMKDIRDDEAIRWELNCSGETGGWVDSVRDI